MTEAAHNANPGPASKVPVMSVHAVGAVTSIVSDLITPAEPNVSKKTLARVSLNAIDGLADVDPTAEVDPARIDTLRIPVLDWQPPVRKSPIVLVLTQVAPEATPTRLATATNRILKDKNKQMLL